jgi:diacylglycerol O-acyltransferase / wax synthase
MDHASYVALRALRRGPVGQSVWIYDRGVDMDALRRFHRNLGFTLLGRRIERSPLPFGRHRWVACAGPDSIAVATRERSRAEVWDWANERAKIPVDPETGPAWHLAVQPLIGGGAAVSLVFSHTIADGAASTLSIVAAVEGVKWDLPYPAPGSRSPGRAIRQDIATTARLLPGIPSALIGTVRLQRRQAAAQPKPKKKPRTAKAPSRPDQPVTVPMVAASIDAASFDQKVADLGGTRNSLVFALAARLGHALGRVDDDAKVMLVCPVSERTEGDTRGNALNVITVAVDPDAALHDLGPLRKAVKEALVEMQEIRDAMMAPLPLIPFVPTFLMAAVEKAVLQEGQPIGCSNAGDMPPALSRIDGGEADFFIGRMIENGVTEQAFARRGGHLALGVTIARGVVAISIASWKVGGPNSAPALAGAVTTAFADFGLAPTIEW